MGKIIVIVAPSGTGKSTLIKRLKKDFPDLEESVSHTTRPIREGEKDGVNYFYISKKEFEALKEQGEFLEWATVHSNYYGTSKSFVESRLIEGAQLLFDLDVQGAEFFRDYFKERANIIFLEPPSIEELENRLLNRGTESTEVIKERIANAKEELKKKDHFDYLVLNDDYDMAYEQTKSIFKKILEES